MASYSPCVGAVDQAILTNPNMQERELLELRALAQSAQSEGPTRDLLDLFLSLPAPWRAVFLDSMGTALRRRLGKISSDELAHQQDELQKSVTKRVDSPEASEDEADGTNGTASTDIGRFLEGLPARVPDYHGEQNPFYAALWGASGQAGVFRQQARTRKWQRDLADAYSVSSSMLGQPPVAMNPIGAPPVSVADSRAGSTGLVERHPRNPPPEPDLFEDCLALLQVGESLSDRTLRRFLDSLLDNNLGTAYVDTLLVQAVEPQSSAVLRDVIQRCVDLSPKLLQAALSWNAATASLLEHVCKAATLPQRIKLAQTCYRNVHAILRRKHPRPILPSVRRTDPEVCASANLGFLPVLSDPRLPIGVQNKLYQEFCEEKNFIATASSKLGSLAIHDIVRAMPAGRRDVLTAGQAALRLQLWKTDEGSVVLKAIGARFGYDFWKFLLPTLALLMKEGRAWLLIRELVKYQEQEEEHVKMPLYVDVFYAAKRQIGDIFKRFASPVFGDLIVVLLQRKDIQRLEDLVVTLFEESPSRCGDFVRHRILFKEDRRAMTVTQTALENLDNICELSWTSYTTLLVFARGLLPELHKLERSAELEQLEAVVQATVSHTYQSDASSAGTGRFPFGSTSPGTSSWHAGTHQAISQAPANCANFFNQSDTAMPTAATLHFPPLYASQTNQSDMMGPLPPSSLPGGGQTQASLSWTEHPNEVSAVWAWQQGKRNF